MRPGRVPGAAGKRAPERASADAVVAEAMVRAPKVVPAGTTVGQARTAFEDDHVHALLVVDGGRLLAVVERSDLTSAPDAEPARLTGRLHGRVTGPRASLRATRRAMELGRRRRLAVVDEHGALLGLLCVKRSGQGFCSDQDVRSRAAGISQPPKIMADIVDTCN